MPEEDVVRERSKTVCLGEVAKQCSTPTNDEQQITSQGPKEEVEDDAEKIKSKRRSSVKGAFIYFS